MHAIIKVSNNEMHYAKPLKEGNPVFGDIHLLWTSRTELQLLPHDPNGVAPVPSL